MSTLKHTIRHQQAQLHNLENVLHRTPRLSASLMHSPPSSPTVSEPSSPPQAPPTPTKLRRRSSYDILQSLAGPDSSLPLPRRDLPSSSSLKQDGIREGVPMDFGAGPSNKRTPSPTRTLSRKWVPASR